MSSAGTLADTDSTLSANLPVVTNDSADTGEDSSVSINVLADDSDPEGDTLTITGITQGFYGSVLNNGNSISYTSNTGFVGGDSFTCTISDGHGGQATGTVSVSLSGGDSGSGSRGRGNGKGGKNK